MGLLDRAIRGIGKALNESTSNEPPEQTSYKKGFSDGRRGDPREMWQYESESLKSAYNQGYNDGQRARRED